MRERPDTRRLDGLQQEKDRLAALLKVSQDRLAEKRRSLASERDASAAAALETRLRRCRR